MSDEGIHFNAKRDLALKKYTQDVWEGRFGTREDFIRTFGKSYL